MTNHTDFYSGEASFMTWYNKQGSKRQNGYLALHWKNTQQSTIKQKQADEAFLNLGLANLLADPQCLSRLTSVGW